MYIITLPVSGGGFVSQLAIISHLCEIGIKPDLTLASSGGNVAGYVAAAAEWKWPSILRISRELNQDLFAKPWSSISSIAFIMGYFKGEIYNRGNGVSDFLHKNFTPVSISNYEIWTGTYNKNRQKACLFCNRDTSILDLSVIDHDLTQSMTPVFCNSNIDQIATVSIASASIPALVPPQFINDEPYVDGGVAGASPLTIMQEPILKYIRDNDQDMHIIYINSVDLSSSDLSPCHNVLDNWKQVTKDLVRSQTVIDRLSGYELLLCTQSMASSISGKSTINKSEFPCTYDNLLKIREIQRQTRYSLLEIYPTIQYDINITKFSGDDVVNAIHSAYNVCSCRLWWFSPD